MVRSFDVKILCIGSAVMDILGYPIDQTVEWKEKQRIQSIQILPGGDAVNQSIYMAALGAEAMLVACLGSDMNGKMLKAALAELGVNTQFVTEKSGCATGTAMVLVSENAERRIFSVKGAHSTLAKNDVPVISSEYQAISLASLFSMPQFEADGMLEFLKQAKELGIPVFADLAADKLGLGLDGIRRFLPYITYFLPSLYDVLEMTGTKNASEAAAVFHELGVLNVIIKCGADGCYYSGQNGEHGWAPAYPVEVLDTTGAGDCTVAAFICSILRGATLKDACRYACTAGSYSTTFSGASTAELNDAKIREMIRAEQG